MKIVRYLLPALFAMTCVAAEPDTTTIKEREGQPLVTFFREKDPDMRAAMEKARATLPQFEQRLAHPPESQTYISLKGRFEEGEFVEHMWIEDVVVTPQGYRGRLGNKPLDIQSLDIGDEVTVTRDHVSDWFAVDDGKLVGGFTLRLQRSRLPAEKRAEFDAQVGFVIED